MAFLVRDLLEGRPRPVTIKPNHSLEEVLDLMVEHNFSQLPVVDANGKPMGIVTADTILNALKIFSLTVDKVKVSNAMTHRMAIFEPEDDLFEMLDELVDSQVVLITDETKKLVGIVTNYDATDYFRRRAESMMLVEDIEVALREHIRASFSDEFGQLDQSSLADAIKSIESRNGTDFEKLSFYDYQKLLLHPSRWDDYKKTFSDIDPASLNKLLDEVRKMRNTLAHFRDQLTAKQRKQLQFCADWFTQHPPILRDMVVTPAPASTSTSTFNPAVIANSKVTLQSELIGEGKYSLLAKHLLGLSNEVQNTELSFEEIESIIGDNLPNAARKHRAFWANDSVGHTHSQQWLDANWRVANVNMTSRRVLFSRTVERQRAYIAFYSVLLNQLHTLTSREVVTKSPDGSSWCTVFAYWDGVSRVSFNYSFARDKRFRVEAYIDSGNGESNKKLFDFLYMAEEEIQYEFGNQLNWERLDDKRASRIAAYAKGAITDDEEQLKELRLWAAQTMLRFEPILRSWIEKMPKH
jgi:CBS domain-containing protein